MYRGRNASMYLSAKLGNCGLSDELLCGSDGCNSRRHRSGAYSNSVAITDGGGGGADGKPHR
jgi:hypothetical protein